MAATSDSRALRIDTGDGTVGALLDHPAEAFAACVLAHGAGAGMHHGFMASMAQALAANGVATLRFQFPFMERGSKRPDTPAVAHAAIRAAVAAAARTCGGLPLFAGGKSFGGRMTSQAQAAEPLPGVLGLVFVGFPLHPAGKPGTDRALHLQKVNVPMLFLQGTRDALADIGLVRQVVQPLGARVTLHEVSDADHAFAVPSRLKRSQADVVAQLAATAAHWMRSTAHC
jgi:predicted alpha/beta-hydrolase family hydrolase